MNCQHCALPIEQSFRCGWRDGMWVHITGSFRFQLCSLANRGNGIDYGDMVAEPVGPTAEIVSGLTETAVLTDNGEGFPKSYAKTW